MIFHIWLTTYCSKALPSSPRISSSFSVWVLANSCILCTAALTKSGCLKRASCFARIFCNNSSWVDWASSKSVLRGSICKSWTVNSSLTMLPPSYWNNTIFERVDIELSAIISLDSFSSSSRPVTSCLQVSPRMATTWLSWANWPCGSLCAMIPRPKTHDYIKSYFRFSLSFDPAWINSTNLGPACY